MSEEDSKQVEIHSEEKTPDSSEEKTPEDSSSRSEEPKITTAPVKKEKDPKKVAQGKRLAQISKAAKEKKMRDRIEHETKVDFSVDYKSALYITVSSTLVFAGMYLYFSRNRGPEAGPLPKQQPPQKEPQAKKFVSLFD